MNSTFSLDTFEDLCFRTLGILEDEDVIVVVTATFDVFVDEDVTAVIATTCEVLGTDMEEAAIVEAGIFKELGMK